MYGADKTGSIQRLASGSYNDVISEVWFRFSPLKPSSRKGYSERVSHIAKEYRSDIYDIKVADRLIWEDKTYVFDGVMHFVDTLGQHLECIMRELGTELYKNVTLKTPAGVQAGRDVILDEYPEETGKTYTDATVSVLVDPNEAARGDYINYVDAGKLVDTEWVVLMDFPTVVTDKHKIAFDSVLYRILWIVPMPSYNMIGLKKEMLNYEV